MKFLKNDLGYSFHSFYKAQGRIVAAHSIIPVRYSFFGKEILLGLNVDTMIDTPYRNFDVLYDLVTKIEKEVVLSGIVCIIGFPNEKSYPVFTKGFGYARIGNLDVRTIPVRPNAILKKRLVPQRIFFHFLKGVLTADAFVMRFLRQAEQIHPIIRSRHCSFSENRYRWMTKMYHFVSENTNEISVYSIEEMNGLRVAFIISVFSDSRRIFQRTAMKILSVEKNIDMILYVGNAKKLPWYFLSVPNHKRPKEFYFTGKEVVKNVIDARFFEMNHWYIDLSDYDLI